MTDPSTEAETQGEAIDWLAGRLRWERILRELHDQAEGVTPVVTLASIPSDQPGEPDERAA
ncbi:MAG: hypothetical protein ACR2LQ_12110 [Acidimicrobiales bacterium]